MIQTVRCSRCGQTIEAFMDAAAGIPMALSPEAIQNKVQTAKIRHADRCPAGRSPVVPARAKRPWVLTRVLRRAGRRVRGIAL